MARTVTPDPNQLVSVKWRDTGADVQLPYRLLNTGNRAAQERWLIADGQLADPSAPAIEQQEPQQVIQTVTDTAALAGVERRLAALERQPAPILPTDAALAQWAIAAQRVGLSHQELAALVEQTTSSCEATAAAAQARLDGLDAQQAALVEQVSSTLSDAQAAVADSLSAASQQLATFESEVEAAALAKAEAIARKQVGPQGFPGSSTVIAMEDPLEVDPSSFSTRWLGRSLVDGDGVLVVKPDQILVRRYVRGQWQTGPSITPKQELISAKVSALDASTKVTSLQTISGSGGGGGGGGEHLLVNRIGLRGSTAIGDTSNWAGISDIRSGIASIDLLAMDGGNQGKTYAVELPFTWDTSGDQFTADGELGNLLGLYTVSLSVQRSAAVAPAVFTGSMPPGAQRLVTFLTVTPAPGGGGDTTQFRLSGSISYNHVAQGAAVSVQSGGLQPLWIWS